MKLSYISYEPIRLDGATAFADHFVTFNKMIDMMIIHDNNNNNNNNNEMNDSNDINNNNKSNDGNDNSHELKFHFVFQRGRPRNLIFGFINNWN